MKKALFVLAVSVIVIAVVVVAVSSATGQGSRLQENKLTAQQDARVLLARLRLPEDVKTSSRRPTEDGTQTNSSPPVSSVGDSDHGWWTSSGAPQTIVNYIRSHRPDGAKLQSWGSDGNGSAGRTALTLMYVWPPLRQATYNRTLTISVIYKPRGRSAIVANSQSYWIVPRPTTERVPSDARVVDATLRLGRGPQGNEQPVTTTHAFTHAATVDRLIKNIDALTTVQPGLIYNCPMFSEANRPKLTLAFKASPAGPVLAKAVVDVSPGKNGASGWTPCDPIDFWVDEKPQKPLTSDTFVNQVAHLIGADIS
jgi:hypothetical protein